MLQIHGISVLGGTLGAGQIEGHCGARAPEFFTRKRGRAMIVEFHEQYMVYGYRDRERLLMEISEFDHYPEDYPALVAKTQQVAAPGQADRLDVTCVHEGCPGWLIRLSGIIVHRHPIICFGPALDTLEHFMRTRIITSCEAIHLLKLMMKAGLPEWPEFDHLRRLGFEQYWAHVDQCLSVLGEKILRESLLDTQIGR